MYVFMCTRPDLAFLVNILSRFQSNLAKNHLEGVKQVMRYLKTKSFCLTYQASELKLISYFDSDYEGCVDTRKSISDFIFVFGDGAIHERAINNSTFLNPLWRISILLSIWQLRKLFISEDS